MRDCGVMQLSHLLRRVAFEGDGAAVGGGCRLVVDRFANAKSVAVVSIEESSMTAIRLVAHRLTRSKRPERRVLETLGTLNTVRSNHGVIKHMSFPS